MREKYLFIDKPLSELVKEIQGEKKDVFRRLYELARVYKEMDLPEEHPDKSITFMGFASFNLSLLYILTKQKEYLKEAKRWIFTAARYPHWGNKFLVDVDLSAAFLLFGLSIAYDWLKDDLTEEEEKELAEKIHLQAFRMYKFKKENEHKGWPTAYFQNHNWINMTGLATCGLALKDRYDDMDEIVEDAKQNFDKVYEYMPNDGSDYEGVVYWRYGVIWLYIYGHLAKTELDRDFFKECDFLRETFFYRLYQAAPNLEEIANYGDCHDKKSGHSTAMYYKIAAEYDNGFAQNLGDEVAQNFVYREQYESKVKPGILSETGLELLWYNPKVKTESFDKLPTVKHFEDLGLVVMRDSWEKDSFHLSFKCGLPGGKKQFDKSFEIQRETGVDIRGLSHQHPDNNSIILMAKDTYLAIDEGYNRTVKACEHNVFTIDGKGYRDEGQNNVWHNLKEEYTAEITDYTSENGVTYFKGNTHKMYVDELKLTKYSRHILYTSENYFYMIDELESELEHTYTFNLHTEVEAEKDGETTFKYENGPGKMKFFVNSKENMKTFCDNTYVKAIMTSQEPDVFRQVNMDTLHIENTEKSKEYTLASIMKTDGFFEDEKFEVTNILNGDTIGFEVNHGGNTEIFLFSKTGIEYKDIKNNNTVMFIKNDKVLFSK